MIGAAPGTMSEAELQRFERINAIYKSVDGIPFEVSLLIPKITIFKADRKCPVLVHFHGGAFILGTALDPPTLPRWMLQLAENRGVVVVSPCYRLLPEATGTQIIDDVKDFWAWLYLYLETLISERWSNVSVDLNRIAVAGHGSGGTLALQSAFLWPQTRIKVIMAQSCAMDPDSSAFNPKPHELSEDLEAYVSDYLAHVRPGTFRVSSPFPEYLELLHAVFETGRWRELLGDDQSLYIRKNLREAGDVPPIWITQGSEDRIVSRVAANELVAEIRSAHPETPLLYRLVPGGHGFDVNMGWGEAWVQDGVRFADKYW